MAFLIPLSLSDACPSLAENSSYVKAITYEAFNKWISSSFYIIFHFLEA